MSSRFGSMLLNRRRELGLSIQQVSNVIKLRPQTIECFELGRVDDMPPRGYATGMISSYARYLGLNPREVIDAYYDELEIYERVNNTGAGRLQDSVAEASPHSDNTAGRFYIVNSVPNSRYAQRPPQAGYVSESSSRHESAPVSSLRPERQPHRLRYAQQRSLPAATGDRHGSPAPQPRDRYAGRDRSTGMSGRSYPAGYPSGGFARSQGPSRPMPLPSDQRPGRGGYGSQGRRRPAGRPAPAPSGLDPRLLIGGGLVVFLVLMVLAMFAFKSCSAKPEASDQQSQQTPAASSDAVDSSADIDFFEDEPVASPSAPGGAPADGVEGETDDTQTGETVVTISIAKGKTSWVEVKLDGKYVYSDTPVGPFEQEYTVGTSIEITVDNPADVVIRKNGEKVRYDSKSSGVGRVTIVAPTATGSAPAPDAAGEAGSDAGDSDDSASSSSTQSGTVSSGAVR